MYCCVPVIGIELILSNAAALLSCVLVAGEVLDEKNATLDDLLICNASFAAVAHTAAAAAAAHTAAAAAAAAAHTAAAAAHTAAAAAVALCSLLTVALFIDAACSCCCSHYCRSRCWSYCRCSHSHRSHCCWFSAATEIEWLLQGAEIEVRVRSVLEQRAQEDDIHYAAGRGCMETIRNVMSLRPERIHERDTVATDGGQ